MLRFGRDAISDDEPCINRATGAVGSDQLASPLPRAVRVRLDSDAHLAAVDERRDLSVSGRLRCVDIRGAKRSKRGIHRLRSEAVRRSASRRHSTFEYTRMANTCCAVDRLEGA